MSRFLPAGWFGTRRQLKVAKAREPRKNRTGTFSTVTLGAAAIAFLLALFGVGPFAAQALVIDFGRGSGGALPASAVFPTVSPVQKIVDTYDSPRPAPAPKTAPKPAPRPSPSPTPTEPHDSGGDN